MIMYLFLESVRLNISGPEKGDINMDFGSGKGLTEQKRPELELRLGRIGTGKEKGNDRLRVWK